MFHYKHFGAIEVSADSGAKMNKLMDHLHGQNDEMLSLLERLVNIDSGTFSKEGVDACGRIIAGELEVLGFKTLVLPEKDYGDHLRADRPGKGE